MNKTFAFALAVVLALAFAPDVAVAMDDPGPAVSAEHEAGKKAIAAKNWDAAIQALTAAERRDGRNADIQNLLGYAYRNSGKLTADSVSDALGRPVDGTVCNDFPTVIESVNEGRLLNETDPSAKVTRAIHDLVPLVHELPQVPKRNSLFARWGMR